MRKLAIYQAYGAWIAEDNYGNTIWARSRGELMRLFGQPSIVGGATPKGGSPC